MGVYYDIHLDSILVEGGKSFIPDSLLSMFQESDRQILTISEMEKKYPWVFSVHRNYIFKLYMAW